MTALTLARTGTLTPAAHPFLVSFLLSSSLSGIAAHFRQDVSMLSPLRHNRKMIQSTLTSHLSSSGPVLRETTPRPPRFPVGRSSLPDSTRSSSLPESTVSATSVRSGAFRSPSPRSDVPLVSCSSSTRRTPSVSSRVTPSSAV